jgi:hypothetical protein
VRKENKEKNPKKVADYLLIIKKEKEKESGEIGKNNLRIL